MIVALREGQERAAAAALDAHDVAPAVHVEEVEAARGGRGRRAGRRVGYPVQQSDNFLIGLRQPLSEPEEARYRLEEWFYDNPDKRVSILHYYDDNRIEEVNP